MAIHLAFDRMMSSRIPSGVLPDEWTALGARLVEAMPAVHSLAMAGRLGFRDLEAQAEEFDAVVAFAAEVRGRYDDLVILGIGGSALGAIALRTALGSAEGRPRLHVLDNVDPVAVAATLAAVTLSRTCTRRPVANQPFSAALAWDSMKVGRQRQSPSTKTR